MAGGLGRRSRSRRPGFSDRSELIELSGEGEEEGGKGAARAEISDDLIPSPEFPSSRATAVESPIRFRSGSLPGTFDPRLSPGCR